MSRQHKITIVIFFLGVLLCGVGVGVAFTEFSALTYGGTYILGGYEMKTEDLDVKLESDGEIFDIEGFPGPFTHRQGRIQTDAGVPADTVRFRVTYNAKRVEPFAYWNEEDEQISFSWHWKNYDSDMALMMEAKDVVLQNLKEGKVVSFDDVGLEEVAVFVNPRKENRVRIAYH